MNLEIKVIMRIGESIYKYSGEKSIRLIAFKGEISRGKIRLKDHDEYMWISKHKLAEVKLAPADIPIIELI